MNRRAILRQPVQPPGWPAGAFREDYGHPAIDALIAEAERRFADTNTAAVRDAVDGLRLFIRNQLALRHP